MKLCILSRNRSCYSPRRLVEAVKARGHQARVLDPLRFAISSSMGRPALFYRGAELEDYDGVIPRIGASVTFYGTSVVRQFEQMNVFCANSAMGIANSRDKLRSMQILSRYDIGIPPTEFVRDKDDVLPAIERAGGAPVIIKLLEGTQGVGVILADSVKVAQAIIETLQSTRQNVLIQKFVAESRGKDLRAFVVGDRVVGAMRRTAVGDEFRSNVHRGGQVQSVELDPLYAQTAVRAAQILGLRVAGVDMLEGATGPSLMEVNSSPGLEGIEAATGADIAGEIVDYVVENVAHPELDIRQMLTVSKGYGVVALQVGDDVLANKTIEASGLRDRDIVVLSLARDGKIIPNPKASRELLVGDRLTCWGKYANVRDLLPPLPRRTPGRRKKKAPKEA
ncbi:MAG TPA: 30S ribosomal protein S6--L-glutamate ligase [Myxococcales bacterium]|nr:30S ribosomal protein S6--L-glutamate ligase [Myxococcales bacterium]